MNNQSQDRIHHHWLSWIGMLAFAAVLSPINIHFVIAQETPEIVVAPADPGEPPAPPQAPATEASASAAPAQVPVEPVNQTAIQPAEAPAAEPAPASAPAQTPEVPATPSEISSDTELSKLLPKEEPFAEAQASADARVRTLSVQPGTRPMLPDDHPAWVDAPSDFSSTQHYLHVGSLHATDPRKLDEALELPLIAAVQEYIDQEVIHQSGAANSMPITADFIRRNLIDTPEGYECELKTASQERLYQKWVTVRITPEQRDQFRQWHTEAVQRTRLKPLGINLVAVLVLVSLSHVVLRRFSGASPLAAVNQQPHEQIVSRKSRSSVYLIFFALLFGAVAFAFLLPLFAIIGTTPTSVSVPLEVEVGELPDLHKEVRIETLDGGHRTIILESKSHR